MPNPNKKYITLEEYNAQKQAKTNLDVLQEQELNKQRKRQALSEQGYRAFGEYNNLTPDYYLINRLDSPLKEVAYDKTGRIPNTNSEAIQLLDEAQPASEVLGNSIKNLFTSFAGSFAKTLIAPGAGVEDALPEYVEEGLHDLGINFNNWMRVATELQNESQSPIYIDPNKGLFDRWFSVEGLGTIVGETGQIGGQIAGAQAIALAVAGTAGALGAGGAVLGALGTGAAVLSSMLYNIESEGAYQYIDTRDKLLSRGASEEHANELAGIASNQTKLFNIIPSVIGAIALKNMMGVGRLAKTPVINNKIAKKISGAFEGKTTTGKVIRSGAFEGTEEYLQSLTSQGVQRQYVADRIWDIGGVKGLGNIWNNAEAVDSFVAGLALGVIGSGVGSASNSLSQYMSKNIEQKRNKLALNKLEEASRNSLYHTFSSLAQGKLNEDMSSDEKAFFHHLSTAGDGSMLEEGTFANTMSNTMQELADIGEKGDMEAFATAYNKAFVPEKDTEGNTNQTLKTAEDFNVNLLQGFIKATKTLKSPELLSVYGEEINKDIGHGRALSIAYNSVKRTEEQGQVDNITNEITNSLNNRINKILPQIEEHTAKIPDKKEGEESKGVATKEVKEIEENAKKSYQALRKDLEETNTLIKESGLPANHFIHARLGEPKNVNDVLSYIAPLMALGEQISKGGIPSVKDIDTNLDSKTLKNKNKQLQFFKSIVSYRDDAIKNEREYNTPSATDDTINGRLKQTIHDTYGRELNNRILPLYENGLLKEEDVRKGVKSWMRSVLRQDNNITKEEFLKVYKELPSYKRQKNGSKIVTKVINDRIQELSNRSIKEKDTYNNARLLQGNNVDRHNDHQRNTSSNLLNEINSDKGTFFITKEKDVLHISSGEASYNIDKSIKILEDENTYLLKNKEKALKNNDATLTQILNNKIEHNNYLLSSIRGMLDRYNKYGYSNVDVSTEYRASRGKNRSIKNISKQEYKNNKGIFSLKEGKLVSIDNDIGSIPSDDVLNEADLLEGGLYQVFSVGGKHSVATYIPLSANNLFKNNSIKDAYTEQVQKIVEEERGDKKNILDRLGLLFHIPSLRNKDDAIEGDNKERGNSIFRYRNDLYTRTYNKNGIPRNRRINPKEYHKTDVLPQFLIGVLGNSNNVMQKVNEATYKIPELHDYIFTNTEIIEETEGDGSVAHSISYSLPNVSVSNISNIEYNNDKRTPRDESINSIIHDIRYYAQWNKLQVTNVAELRNILRKLPNYIEIEELNLSLSDYQYVVSAISNPANEYNITTNGKSIESDNVFRNVSKNVTRTFFSDSNPYVSKRSKVGETGFEYYLSTENQNDIRKIRKKIMLSKSIAGNNTNLSNTLDYVKIFFPSVSSIDIYKKWMDNVILSRGEELNNTSRDVIWKELIKVTDDYYNKLPHKDNTIFSDNNSIFEHEYDDNLKKSSNDLFNALSYTLYFNDNRYQRTKGISYRDDITNSIRKRGGNTLVPLLNNGNVKRAYYTNQVFTRKTKKQWLTNKSNNLLRSILNVENIRNNRLSSLIPFQQDGSQAYMLQVEGITLDKNAVKELLNTDNYNSLSGKGKKLYDIIVNNVIVPDIKRMRRQDTGVEEIDNMKGVFLSLLSLNKEYVQKGKGNKERIERIAIDINTIQDDTINIEEVIDEYKDNFLYAIQDYMQEASNKYTDIITEYTRFKKGDENTMFNGINISNENIERMNKLLGVNLEKVKGNENLFGTMDMLSNAIIPYYYSNYGNAVWSKGIKKIKEEETYLSTERIEEIRSTMQYNMERNADFFYQTMNKRNDDTHVNTFVIDNKEGRSYISPEYHAKRLFEIGYINRKELNSINNTLLARRNLQKEKGDITLSDINNNSDLQFKIENKNWMYANIDMSIKDISKDSREIFYSNGSVTPILNEMHIPISIKATDKSNYKKGGYNVYINRQDISLGNKGEAGVYNGEGNNRGNLIPSSSIEVGDISNIEREGINKLNNHIINNSKISNIDGEAISSMLKSKGIGQVFFDINILHAETKHLISDRGLEKKNIYWTEKARNKLEEGDAIVDIGYLTRQGISIQDFIIKDVEGNYMVDKEAWEDNIFDTILSNKKYYEQNSIRQFKIVGFHNSDNTVIVSKNDFDKVNPKDEWQHVGYNLRIEGREIRKGYQASNNFIDSILINAKKGIPDITKHKKLTATSDAPVSFSDADTMQLLDAVLPHIYNVLDSNRKLPNLNNIQRKDIKKAIISVVNTIIDTENLASYNINKHTIKSLIGLLTAFSPDVILDVIRSKSANEIVHKLENTDAVNLLQHFSKDKDASFLLDEATLSQTHYIIGSWRRGGMQQSLITLLQNAKLLPDNLDVLFSHIDTPSPDTQQHLAILMYAGHEMSNTMISHSRYVDSTEGAFTSIARLGGQDTIAGRYLLGKAEQLYGNVIHHLFYTFVGNRRVTDYLANRLKDVERNVTWGITSAYLREERNDEYPVRYKNKEAPFIKSFVKDVNTYIGENAIRINPYEKGGFLQLNNQYASDSYKKEFSEKMEEYYKQNKGKVGEAVIYLYANNDTDFLKLLPNDSKKEISTYFNEVVREGRLQYDTLQKMLVHSFVTNEKERNTLVKVLHGIRNGTIEEQLAYTKELMESKNNDHKLTEQMYRILEEKDIFNKKNKDNVEGVHAELNSVLGKYFYILSREEGNNPC